MRQLLDRANHVCIRNIFRAKAKIWMMEDEERLDEYKRVQGLREDGEKFMTKICLLAQEIYFENPDLFDSEINS